MINEWEEFQNWKFGPRNAQTRENEAYVPKRINVIHPTKPHDPLIAMNKEVKDTYIVHNVKHIKFILNDRVMMIGL